ncbi:response regulator [Desulfosudis oleivorans]|uniref:Two component transcriptional regulator, winged helix family n=1 Tax=Desulfosudis oleivorans (strain DSM 6200 / JCM 39069 / Hxd3) TaxID=96561 RepID=A8ZYB8_DESOH|nr:response regulator [Desulfosudis oleivorans]ABW67125.1 two component transcriptional regulator, winged helix family [Desulfosudis oleivorans Hxd3]
MTHRILIIDDDKALQALLRDYFEESHLEVAFALTGLDGIKSVAAGTPCDIVVLDIMLPDIDGFETLKKIRAISQVPVIMLTAREDQADRIIGLELGADDYMHKPFNPRELLARIKAVLRRATASAEAAPVSSPSACAMVFGSVEIDFAGRVLRKSGREIAMTGVETDILNALISHKGTPLTRDRLLDLASGRDFETFDRSIDVHISRIRKKLEDDPSAPRYIKTVWGKGYMWAE